MAENEFLLQNMTDSGVLKITLNQPQKRNALSQSMLRALLESYQAAEQNPKVRVIILAAKGPVFCAGHDLKEVQNARAHQDGGKAFFRDLFNLCALVMQTMVNHPKPIIAEVQGIATAAGCQLVASADLAIAVKQAKFATPGVNIGLFCSTPMVALSRNVSNKQAMQMLLTGDMISANKAQKIGLINQVCQPSKLSQKTNALAEKMAHKSATVLKIGKKAFYQQLEMGLKEAYQYSSEVMVMNMLQLDAKEGIDAFVNKRVAKWQD